MRKSIGIFYKLSSLLPLPILRMLYFAIVYPRLLYGVAIYANTYLTHIHDLIILNNRILRIIQHQKVSCHTVDLYSAFNTLPIDKLFNMQVLLHAHKLVYKSDKLPLFSIIIIYLIMMFIIIPLVILIAFIVLVVILHLEPRYRLTYVLDFGINYLLI